MSKPKVTSYSGAALRLAREERERAAADPAEQARRTLAGHERVIENARRSFVALGKALLAIRSERLYAAEYSTFAEYCEGRWDVSETYANRMINAALVAIEATPIGVEINSEAVARELVGLTGDALRQVWDEASRRAAGGRVTAALVKEVRRSLEAPKSEALEGEIVDPVSKFPAVEDAINQHFANQASGLVDDTSPVDESGEDRTDEDASGTADRDASSAQPGASGVTLGSAPAEHVETPPGPEDSTPADEPEQAAEGVPLPAPATPKSFDEVLDEHVPNLDPHQKWRAAFLKAVRQSYALSSFAIEDIATNGNDLCFEELINLRDFMDELLTKVQQKRIENLPDNVREFRRPA